MTQFQCNWIFRLRSWHFDGQKFLGNHPVWLSRGGPPFGREQIAFWTLLQRIFWQKTISCVRGDSLRDWLPWCLWIVKQGLGLENCLDTLRFLGMQKNVFQYIQSQGRLKVEQLQLEFFLFRRQWRHDSVSIWIEISNCGIDILVAILETIQFGCHVGGPPLEEKELLFEHFYKDFSGKKQAVVFVDIPYVIGCRDVCGSWSKGLVWRTVLTP